MLSSIIVSLRTILNVNERDGMEHEMIVGFMRNFANPPYMAKLTAMLCKYHGIDLIYMRPSDINMETNMVNGKIFVKNRWQNVETELPPFIDISQYCFKKRNRDIINYLRNNTILSGDKINALSKEKLQNELKKDEAFRHLVIPTMRAKQFSDLEDFLNKYAAIVLKPIHGERGRGVYILRKEKDTYVLGYQKNEKKYSKDELELFFNTSIKSRKYISQKYISSRTVQGDPFDCRVHVQKDGKGKWVVARIFIRIGLGQKVISNVNQGGGISDPEPFLKANFGERWEEILDKINHLAVTLPYKIEEIRNLELITLGFDIAIDKDGELYLFESNGAPTTNPLKAESAMLRADYYKYVLENKVDKKLLSSKTSNNVNQLKIENQALKKELEHLKKRNKKMETSSSWRVTKPLRALGKIVKK